MLSVLIFPHSWETKCCKFLYFLMFAWQSFVSNISSHLSKKVLSVFMCSHIDKVFLLIIFPQGCQHSDCGVYISLQLSDKVLSVFIFPLSDWGLNSCKSDSLLVCKLWVRTDSLNRRGFTFTDGNRQNVRKLIMINQLSGWLQLLDLKIGTGI